MPRSPREYMPPLLALALILICLCRPCAAAPENSAHIVKKTDQLNVNVSYPTLNSEIVDKDIAAWASGLVESVQDMMGKDQDDGGAGHPFELRVDYELSHPSAEAVSITFNVATYTGGAHDNLDIIVLSYDLNSGSRLGMADIFEDPESALNIMSSYSYNALAAKFGPERMEDMLKSGTTPDMDNFSSIALDKGGVRVHFQPYQVAPWSYGPQRVEIPLEELHDAVPRLSLWGKK